MPRTGPRAASLLRDRTHHDGGRVGMVELFFDLVFVFAITQLSHHLLEHLTPLGALRTALLFMAVWWLWIYTTWSTNWLDPDRNPVRLMLLAMMAGGLVLSAALPLAFGARGAAFGIAFAAMQVGRTAFALLAFHRHGRRDQRDNFVRILAWLSLSGALWIIGGLAEPGARLAWWAAAVAVEYLGPMAYFRLPFFGRSHAASWDVEAHHMSERCALFVIIALGESLLLTGATFAKLEWTQATALAFGVAFTGSVAMWWLYFDSGAERGTRRLAQAPDTGRVARTAYTYLHLPIVAGIVVSAVSDELILTHPASATNAGIAAILGGPALYLAGVAAFKWSTNDRRLPPLSHLAGLLVLFGLAPFAFAQLLSALALAALCTGVLMLVAAWEWAALRRPAPSPHRAGS